MLKLSNFSVLDSCNDTCDLRILESLYINKLQPQLNDYQLAGTLRVAIQFNVGGFFSLTIGFGILIGRLH